jgi:hypothetical protein
MGNLQDLSFTELINLKTEYQEQLSNLGAGAEFGFTKEPDMWHILKDRVDSLEKAINSKFDTLR